MTMSKYPQKIGHHEESAAMQNVHHLTDGEAPAVGRDKNPAQRIGDLFAHGLYRSA